MVLTDCTTLQSHMDLYFHSVFSLPFLDSLIWKCMEKLHRIFVWPTMFNLAIVVTMAFQILRFVWHLDLILFRNARPWPP